MPGKQFKPGDRIYTEDKWNGRQEGIVAAYYDYTADHAWWVDWDVGINAGEQLWANEKDMHLIKAAPEIQTETSAYDTPTDFKVGDEVYCLLYGDGVVEGVLESENIYPVRVKFSNVPSGGNGFLGYTKDGRYYEDQQRVLFHSKPEVLGGGKLKPSEPEYKGQYVGKEVTLIFKANPEARVIQVVKETPTYLESPDGQQWEKSNYDIYPVTFKNT